MKSPDVVLRVLVLDSLLRVYTKARKGERIGFIRDLMKSFHGYCVGPDAIRKILDVRWKKLVKDIDRSTEKIRPYCDKHGATGVELSKAWIGLVAKDILTKLNSSDESKRSKND